MCKKLSCLTSFVLMLALAGSAGAQLDPSAVSDGHVYLFEGVTGAQLTDDSANSHTGNILGGPETVAGLKGDAMQFDGVDDGIEVPDSAMINNGGPYGERTVVVMFKCDDVDKPGKQVIFEEGGTTRGSVFYVSEGLVYAAAWNRAEYNWDGAWLSAPIESGNWYGVAMVIRGGGEAVEDDKFEMWLNGQLIEKAPGGHLHTHGDDGGIGFCNQNTVFHDGNASPADNAHYFEGAIDELWILNVALTATELGGFAGKVWPYAFSPEPEDGALFEATWANLAWTPGGFAVSNDVYFGTSLEDVNNGAEGTFVGNTASDFQIVGFPGFPLSEGLAPGTTYYWRVDAVDDANAASPWKGDVWSFTVPPKTAYDAYPPDGAENVLPGVVLNWTGGFGVKLHNVYFGDNFDEVGNAAGALPLSDPTYTPAGLEAGKTYYWRVDQFDGAATNKGDVWSFTTVPEIAVTDPSLKLWWKLDEGAGATAVDMSGHGNHGTISGDAQWADGYQGTALTFGTDVYVEASGYDGPTGSSPRTCCAWIRATAGGNQNIMSWGENVTGQKWRMRVEDGSTLRVEVNGGYHYGVTNIVDGSWHHVAVTFEDDGTPDVLDTLLYVDGQLDATGLSQATAIDTAAGPVRIGESPWHNAPFQDQIDDARVYDKVLTAEEIQQVMLGNTKLAGNPQPAAYAIVDIRDTTSLSWSKGDSAASHDVYFGADRDAVASATNESPEFQGNQTALNLAVADKIEFGGGDYFWRVDEVEAGGAVHSGTIWKFTVPDYLVVDDIESYNDLAEEDPASNRVYLAWIDGFGTTTNGALVGNMDVPLTERGNVHGGLQAMPYTYDTNAKTSEATLTLTQRDWTAQGVTKLSLWFRGDAANAPERMFVALNGSAAVYHGDTSATQKTSWTEWVVNLADFGVDLANVSTITIGFGTQNAPAAGGQGTMYFDDIRLVR